METLDLEVSLRSKEGTLNSRRIRREGELPAVLNRPGRDSVSLSINKHNFVLTARNRPRTQVFRLNGVADFQGTLTLVKEVQFDDLKGEPLHIDFLELREGQNVIVEVPVTVEGIPDSVKMGLAMLNQTAYQLQLECLPSAIPTSLTINAANLEAGDSIHARDVVLPEGAQLKSLAALTIVTALVNKRVQGAEVDEAEEAAVPTAGTPEIKAEK